jgi:hypothetical protein
MIGVQESTRLSESRSSVLTIPSRYCRSVVVPVGVRMCDGSDPARCGIPSIWPTCAQSEFDIETLKKPRFFWPVTSFGGRVPSFDLRIGFRAPPPMSISSRSMRPIPI